MKLMFWNIQNVYNHKVLLPDELTAELAPHPDPTKVNTPSPMAQKKIDELLEKTTEFTRATRSAYRLEIAKIIRKVDPDIIVIVELSVGSSDLATSAIPEENRLKFFHFAPMQLQVELNEYYNSFPNNKRKWTTPQKPTTSVNASDLTDRSLTMNKNKTARTIKHKNTIFEFYGIIWDNEKVEMNGNQIQLVWKNVAGEQLSFDEREPGYAQFTLKNQANRSFDLVMIHSIFGSKKDGEKANIQKRANTISKLTQLKVVDDAIVSHRPMVIAGDFNLDFTSQKDLYQPLVDKGFAPRIIDRKTSLRDDETDYFSNAYDNIFTRGFNARTSADRYDFVEQHFQFERRPFEEALQISDHVPVFAVLEFPTGS